MKPTQSPVALRGATQFDMTSKISGRTYRIFVFQPPSAAPPSGYPVVVMTDGNMSFPAAATLDGMFALQGGKAALVVGVGYPADDDAFTPFVQRNRDLTPPTPLSGIRPVPGQPPPKLENYGGSQDFRRFLVEELRPAIAEAYSVDPNDQTLYGHSLGGLFVLGVLFDHPGSFRNFVASSPSIWWNKQAVLKTEPAFADKIRAGAATPRVLILVGAEEQRPPPNLPPGMTRPQMKRLLTQARMVDNARELAERLARIKARPGYSVRFHALDDEDHLTVVPTSISRTLAFALRDDPVKKARKR
ncbi:alpha/beta hydrolase [Phenylobacterium sp.]|uniref:alpha/beta hydrolase n=1 Tax=Phenylobacterium sp. TaxID=1871053 RepID=UPI002F400E8B